MDGFLRPALRTGRATLTASGSPRAHAAYATASVSVLVHGVGIRAPRIAIAFDCHRLWSKHLDLTVTYLPTREIATHQGMHVQPDVPFPEPADHAPEGVVVDVTKGPGRHAVAEVIAPSPQHRVQAVEQISKRSMACSASKRSARLRSMEASAFLDG